MALPFSGPVLAAVNAAAGRALGRPFRIRRLHRAHSPASPGRQQALVVGDGEAAFLLKLGRRADLARLEAEADGLHALREAGVRAPTPIDCSAAAGEAFLLLEHLALRPGRGADYIALAAMVATLHETIQPGYGWHQGNFLGDTAQDNAPAASWAAFWCEQRLGRQLERLALQPGMAPLVDLGERVVSGISGLLAEHQPAASLVHGNLHAGSVGFLANGAPAVFDPAVYAGDRELDIASATLCGPFPGVFYSAYFERFPKDEGYALRRDAYGLYPVLNQLAEGTGPSSAAEQLMRRLLAELG